MTTANISYHARKHSTPSIPIIPRKLPRRSSTHNRIPRARHRPHSASLSHTTWDNLPKIGYNSPNMPPPQILLSCLIPAAYLLGAIPFGLLIALTKGVDPRTAGSKNIGATNVARLLGTRFFPIVFALDLSKSLIPMLSAGFILRSTPLTWQTHLLWLLVGFAAILGHMFPIYLGFKGGKGVATSAGVILGLFPYYTYPAILTLAIWLTTFLIWRYVSLASILASLAFPVLYLGFALSLDWKPFAQQLPLFCFSVLVAILVTFRHRSNISRLRAGTEHRFRSEPPPKSP